MRPQSMAQTVGQLEAAALIERRPDPHDGRQQLIHLTPLGEASIADFRRSAEAWATEAIRSELSASEQAELARGLELLARLMSR